MKVLLGYIDAVSAAKKSRYPGLLREVYAFFSPGFEKIKLWKGNRKDGEWETSIFEIAEKFWASEYGRMEMNLDRRFRLFVTDPDGLDSVFEEKNYTDMIDAVLDLSPHR